MFDPTTTAMHYRLRAQEFRSQANGSTNPANGNDLPKSRREVQN